LIKEYQQVNVDYHLLQKQQVIESNKTKHMFACFSWIIVAIPTAIAAFYLPVTLMCLLYFRIYRETVKRRKELHLLQAQHHTSYAQTPAPTTNNNNNSNGRLTKTLSTIGTTSVNDQDESISTDSNRSHRKVITKQNSSVNKLLSKKFNWCRCYSR